MKNEKKSATINIFLLLLFYVSKIIFCQKTYLEKLTFYCYICIAVASCGRLLKIAVIKYQCSQICIDFVDIVLQPKILGNRLVILTQILIAMDYYFFFYISKKYLQFRKVQKYLLGKIFGSPHTSSLKSKLPKV